MNKYREQLEGTRQLFRIRRIKRAVMLLLLVLLVLLVGYAMALEGAGLKPFYAPLDAALPILLVVLLIATLSNFVFRALEMRYAKRDSQRFLIARNSIRRATMILLVTAIVGGILILPLTGQAANSQLREVRPGELEPGANVTYEFASRDPLALTAFTAGRVEVRSQFAVVRVVAGQDASSGDVWPRIPYEFAVDDTAYVPYTVTIQNPTTQRIQYSMELARVLTPALTFAVPILLLAFAVANGVWMAYLRPLRVRYEASSIYSMRYVEETERGERTYAEYYQAPDAPRAMPAPSGPAAAAPATARAALSPTADLPPPPPPEPEVPEVDVAALMETGSRQFSDGLYQAALATFDEVLEAEPHNILALLAGAAALRRLDRMEESLGAYAQVLAIDPRHAKALASRAQIFEEAERWREAGEAWGAYLDVVPVDIDGRMRHAEALLRTGDRPGAIRSLESALYLSPSDERIRARLDELRIDTPALLSKALVASASGNYEEALSLFDRILAAEPENVNALVSKGVALRRAKRADEALAAFDLALARQPTNAAALRAKGQILEERQAFADALDVYEDLLEASPRDPELWALQGSVLERLGEQEEALASYHEALKLDPANAGWKAKAESLEASRRGHETFLEELFTVKGVGPARARALLSAGYDSPEAIARASPEQLENVRGITRKLASDLVAHFRKAVPQG